MSVELPIKKREQILQLVCKLLNSNTGFFAQFVGLIVAACPAVKYGWLYSKFFERAKYLALSKNNQNYNANMCLDEDCKTDLFWWK